MAHQIGKSRPVKIGAPGNARNTGAPGPTPAPTKTYVNPVLVERSEPTGYGMAKNLGPSSVEPGVDLSSPLAKELKRVNALGDGGDMLQNVIERGTSRGTARSSSDPDLLSPQTRPVDTTQLPASFGMRNRSGETATIPAKTGEALFNPNSIRKPDGK